MSSLIDEAKRLSEQGRYEESSKLIRQALEVMMKNKDVEGLICLATCELPGISVEIDQAIGALGEIGNRKAVEALLNMLGKELRLFHQNIERQHSGFFVSQLVDKGRLIAIVSAMGLLGDELSVKPLIDLMLELLKTSPPSPMSFEEFKEAMGSFQTSPIFRMTDANDVAEVRACIAWALGKIRDGRAVEPLMKLLETDWAWLPRANAAEALGWIGDKRAIQPLRIASEDEEEYVEEKAAEALKRLVREI